MSYIVPDDLTVLKPGNVVELKSVKPLAGVELLPIEELELKTPVPHRWWLTERELTEQQRRSQADLQHLSDYQLRVIHEKALVRQERKALWFINAEYTARKIPPAFRNLPVLDVDCPTMAVDLVAFDLHWIATTYPGHRTRVPQWKGFDNPRHFDSKVRFVFNGMDSGKKPIYKAVHGLALREDQQIECNVFRMEALRGRHEQLRRLHAATRTSIEAVYRRNTRHQRPDPTLLGLSDLHNVTRRTDIWLCANLCRWKSPTRVAALQTAWRRAAGLPVELADSRPLSRQMAHKLMSEIRRDLPAEAAVVR